MGEKDVFVEKYLIKFDLLAIPYKPPGVVKNGRLS